MITIEEAALEKAPEARADYPVIFGYLAHEVNNLAMGAQLIDVVIESIRANGYAAYNGPVIGHLTAIRDSIDKHRANILKLTGGEQ